MQNYLNTTWFAPMNPFRPPGRGFVFLSMTLPKRQGRLLVAFLTIASVLWLSAWNARGDTTNELRDLQIQCEKLIAHHYKLTEAKPLVDQLLPMTLRLRGEVHPDTVIALHWKAYLLSKEGNATEAKKLWERSLSIQAKLPTKEMVWYVRTLHMLARLLWDESEDGPGESLLYDALRLSQETLGVRHAETVWIAKTLADRFELIGQNARGSFER